MVKTASFCSFVSIQYRSVTDRRTYRQKDGFGVAYSAFKAMLCIRGAL